MMKLKRRGALLLAAALLLGLLTGSGRITVGGLRMNKQNIPAIRQKTGFVLQDSDNQMFMPTVYEDMIFGPRNYGLSKEEAEARVDRVLEHLGLQDLKYRYNHKISGGESAWQRLLRFWPWSRKLF